MLQSENQISFLELGFAQDRWSASPEEDGFTCCHGMGIFSSSLYTACGTNLSAPRYTRLSCLNFLEDMSP